MTISQLAMDPGTKRTYEFVKEKRYKARRKTKEEWDPLMKEFMEQRQLHPRNFSKIVEQVNTAHGSPATQVYMLLRL